MLSTFPYYGEIAYIRFLLVRNFPRAVHHFTYKSSKSICLSFPPQVRLNTHHTIQSTSNGGRKTFLQHLIPRSKARIHPRNCLSILRVTNQNAIRPTKKVVPFLPPQIFLQAPFCAHKLTGRQPRSRSWIFATARFCCNFSMNETIFLSYRNGLYLAYGNDRFDFLNRSVVSSLSAIKCACFRLLQGAAPTH